MAYNKTVSIVAAVILLLVAAIFIIKSAYQFDGHSVSSSPSSRTLIADNTIDAKASKRLFPLPNSSLTNTHIDAANIKVDNGKIIIDNSLRFYFEYFLTLQGELPMARIIELLNEDAKLRYSEKAAEYVSALFLRYVNYLAEVASLSKTQSPKDVSLYTVQEILQPIQERRFNEAERLALFDEKFLQQYRDEVTSQGSYNRYKKALSNANEDELEALRVENFGMEVAARFKAIDAQRNKWQQRLQLYQCQHLAVINSQGLVEEDKQVQIKQLQQQQFTAAEQRRVQALLRNGLMPSVVCS